VAYCTRSLFFVSSRRQHTCSKRDWSSDVCSSDLALALVLAVVLVGVPLVARWLPAQEGIIQETDLPRGLPVVVAGQTYLAYDTEIGRASCRENVWRMKYVRGF